MTWAARIPTFAGGDLYPNATLALDFLRGFYKSSAFKGASFASLPGLTVSRASVGYAERQDGTLVQFGNNVARITDKGLLVEESRTNLALRSGDLSNASWTPGAVLVTGNQAVVPDGTQTGALVVATGSVTDHMVTQGVPVTAASYTVTFYAKAAGYFKVGWREATTSGAYATFNLQTATVISTGSGATNATITPSANGWYRIAVTWTGVAQTQTQSLYVLPTAYVSGDPHTNLFAGDNVSGAYFWGAQVELGAFPTSYIPTTSASATRAADGVSVGGLNYAQGTIIARALGAATSSNVRLVGTNGNTTTVLFEAATGIGTYNGTTAQTKATTITPGVAFKAGSTWTVGTRSVTVNGLAPVDDGASGHPTVLSIELGRDATSGGQNFWNSYIQSAVIYPTAFSDAQLQAATQ